MGCALGSDADDFIVLFGTANETKSLIFSFNIERRGIFSKTYPEHKFRALSLRLGDLKVLIINFI